MVDTILGNLEMRNMVDIQCIAYKNERWLCDALYWFPWSYTVKMIHTFVLCRHQKLSTIANYLYQVILVYACSVGTQHCDFIWKLYHVNF